ncbi:uncharacterized protein N7511_001752 [Penicillium nucicola]|uniref:uncharacterized protein n=1 Tax=Penicillium nucicola TaxID=1850975 RepID=UPI0025452E32|nr:uncharacterized protein N7511_008344 [Penicillium nucicola]XP_056988150.1 uncharacterized protein N7511_003566 [Penicillium nucicola]XP_056989885.1 uncharacterized protein N7511_001727 [Penicillium nucicola]XP_056989910.1 uncharacterized protein N7511_001752 [Penicillium nucicola]KAJ5751379.1 hypothetical protein N7511_008344 [Penicillium nucicola]KAJ5771515.1 hypothetical protein N7511_003566 [Penicillium nucicola]KAJ5776716.1 hypothetical protein N7511_001727 [Penicillium nucicola]KAJ57
MPCGGEPNGIGHETRRTYVFNDCTIDNTSMISTGRDSSRHETVILRDAASGRAIFANGDMSRETFLREFCGKK